MQTIGIIDIIWRGQQLPVEKGSTIMLGGMKNNPIIYGRGLAYSRENTASKIKCSIVLAKGQRVDDLYYMDEDELQVKTDINSTYVFPRAILVNRPELNDSGKFNMEWDAGVYEEVSA